MDREALIGKRKKTVKRCPNPLFVKWLEEEIDEAVKKGFKSHFGLKKALAALKKYPLPLASGKACKVLDHFGEKTCQLLDQKLQAHIAQFGSASPVSSPEPSPVKRKAKKRTSRPEEHDQWSSEDEQPAPAKQRRKSATGPKEYIPKHRTGGYAIILTLYRFLQQPGNVGFMTKRQLMDDAQPLARESFTMPNPGSRYTAWSSMGSLRKKGYVIQNSNPAKYKLSDAGHALAQKIIEQEALGMLSGMNKDIETTSRLDAVSAGPSRIDGANPQNLRLPTMAWSDDEIETTSTNTKTFERTKTKAFVPDVIIDSDSDANSEHWHDTLGPASSSLRQTIPANFSSSRANSDKILSPTENTERLKFWYVAEDGSEHVVKDKAEVTITDAGVGFLIKCRNEDLLTSGRKLQLDKTRGGSGGYVYGYLSDTDATEIAQPPAFYCSGVRPMHEIGNLSRGTNTQPVPSIKPSTSATTKTQANPVIKPCTSATIEKTWSRPNERTPSWEEPKGRGIRTLPEPEFILESGTFDIVLCVDQQEKNSRRAQELLPELTRSGVQFELRKLQVGDFLWVARPKRLGFGQNNGDIAERELVLDYIIERKRMDDLAGSIIDGRFVEQKTRMRSSGLRQKIYLVENYGPMQNFRIEESALNQAITNTQVIDGFYVKRTNDQRDSILYLTVMTRHLQRLYSNKRLLACKSSALNGDSVSPNAVNSKEQYLMTYNEFDSKTKKNKPLMVKEVFIKQLVQASGLSLEKACALTRFYPTPKTLMDRLETCCSEADQVQLLQAIKGSGRGLGKPLATTLAKLYTSKTALN